MSYTLSSDFSFSGRVLADLHPTLPQGVNLCEQEQILRMVQWRTAGLTWYAIAKRLNGDGIKTKNNGRVWCGGTVSKLTNSRTVKDWLAARNNNLVTDPT